jgi:hypothetical protein
LVIFEITPVLSPRLSEVCRTLTPSTQHSRKTSLILLMGSLTAGICASFSGGRDAGFDALRHGLNRSVLSPFTDGDPSVHVRDPGVHVAAIPAFTMARDPHSILRRAALAALNGEKIPLLHELV